MILTESEARAKWCPFARVAYVGTRGDVAVLNRGSADADVTGRSILNPPESRCIASDCMAWAWLGEPQADRFGKCGLTDGGGLTDDGK